MSRIPRLRAACFAMLLALLGAAPAAGSDGRIQGVVRDAEGQPVAACRVIARAAENTTAFVSPPSDEQGRYALTVPSGSRYILLAVVVPSGRRVPLPEEPFLVGTATATRDLTIPQSVARHPRRALDPDRNPDRLFLAFVEDPALALGGHYEAQIATEDFQGRDRNVIRGIAAVQFENVPRVELGVRAGYGNLEIEGFSNESGPTDLDAWGKFLLFPAAGPRTEVAVGAIATLPTGDADAGLGRDAIQAKLFASVSYAWGEALFVAHAGAATSEDGEVFGVPLDGQVAPAASVGLLVPFAPSASAVFEASYEGERFDGTRADASVLAGASWRIGGPGKLRLAVSAGLGETSELAAITAGYAIGR